MSRLQAIENAISTINPAVFQEMCDSFLALRNANYSAFSRTGSQSGKQKTTKGTPDTFLLLPNGKYIFVEYSTNVTDGVSKLIADINKCIDTSKTGIPLNQIAEIIFCINFNLKANEIKLLVDTLGSTSIALTVYTLDSLALELHLNHRDLIHQYLGLPLDTGQIVSMENFIAEYNKASKGVSTQLDNTFQHREEELKELNDAINTNDFVILTGAPGIGKTKLALEGIKSFLSENLTFGAYCVSYKHHTLLDDLYQYFDSDKDYILFVDDANRIDAFNQITGFYKATRKGKLKILITVRDYAFQDIGILCQEYAPRRLELLKFNDEQIIDIIKAKPFDILNPDYHREIVRIADGNPRLAIMTSLLAKAEQNIYALHDVSDLFENYFSTFVKDDGEFAKSLNIKCLGLIAFFYTIPYKNREITTSILENFGIEYSTFIDSIDKLDKLELVEIRYDHVKIPEQNLSTYFFYKAFIKDSLLSFEVLLNNYFDKNSKRFRDCVIPANNTFGPSKVMDKLRPFLKSYWAAIKASHESAFKFLATFWYYLSDEALEFLFTLIDSLPTVKTDSYNVTYENNAFSSDKNDVLELAGEFFHFPNHLKESLELAFEYVRKKPEHLPELIHKIREQMTFDREDERYRFQRQVTLFEILVTGLNKMDLLMSTAFYELSKTFLLFQFQHTKGGRNHSILLYRYPIPNTQPIQQFRKTIWDSIELHFKMFPLQSIELLKSYSAVSPDVSKDIMMFDTPLLVGIIEKHLTSDSFDHCRYVQDQIRWCQRNSISHPSFISLASKFRNPVYESFLKLDWDRWRDKEMYEFKYYREYEKLKEAEIRSSFVFSDVDQIKQFYKTFALLKGVTKNGWNFNSSLDLVIDENLSRNFDLGCEFLSLVIISGNEVHYIPRVAFRNHLNSKEKSERIWSILQQQEFTHKDLWELAFYDYLNDTLISEKYTQALVNTVSSMRDSNTIHFDRLKRFLVIEPKLFQIILRAIVYKNEKDGTRLQVWMDFFSEHFDQLGDDIELIKTAYLQQDKIQNHFDYEGKGFLNILKKDSKFIIQYLNDLYADKPFGLSGDHRNLSFVWQVDDIEKVLGEVFDLVIQKESYLGILDHFCNSFFRNLQGKENEKAKTFLLSYCNANASDPDKINVVVDIARHTMKEIFDEIMLLFLSLNQDKEAFSKIWWRGNGGSYSGDVIIGDIEAAEWQNILATVNKSTVGIKLIPIKKYINEQIEYNLRSGDRERQRRFLGKDW